MEIHSAFSTVSRRKKMQRRRFARCRKGGVFISGGRDLSEGTFHSRPLPIARGRARWRPHGFSRRGGRREPLSPRSDGLPHPPAGHGRGNSDWG